MKRKLSSEEKLDLVFGWTMMDRQVEVDLMLVQTEYECKDNQS